MNKLFITLLLLVGCSSNPIVDNTEQTTHWVFVANGKKPIYPDMNLYQEIIFLENHFKGKYCVENVIPYYEPLIPAQKRGRHLYWTNFKLPSVLSSRKGMKGEKNTESLKHYNEVHQFDFSRYKGAQLVLKIARNLVDYQAGRTIYETALNITRANNAKQNTLF